MQNRITGIKHDPANLSPAGIGGRCEGYWSKFCEITISASAEEISPPIRSSCFIYLIGKGSWTHSRVLNTRNGLRRHRSHRYTCQTLILLSSLFFLPYDGLSYKFIVLHRMLSPSPFPRPSAALHVHRRSTDYLCIAAENGVSIHKRSRMGGMRGRKLRSITKMRHVQYPTHATWLKGHGTRMVRGATDWTTSRSAHKVSARCLLWSMLIQYLFAKSSGCLHVERLFRSRAHKNRWSLGIYWGKLVHII